MKKYFSLVLVLVIALFIGMNRVDAYYANYGTCPTGSTQNCTYGFNDITSADVATLQERIFSVTFYTKNATITNYGIDTTKWVILKQETVTPTSGYDNGVKFTIVTKNKSTITTGNLVMGAFSYTKASQAVSGCKVGVSPAVMPTNRYTCQKVGENYFDKNGNVVSQSEYKASCGCRTPEYDYATGTYKYYDQNGNETTYETYDIQCLTHNCEKIGNTYFGSSGTVVTQDQYASQCGQKCLKIGDTWYDKNGNAVASEDAMIASCSAGTCRKVEKTDHTYVFFGSANTVVTEFEYKRQCEKPICGILTSGATKIYFDKNKAEVTEAQYKKSCFACSKDGNKYYDNDGNEVSKYNYQLACESLKCNVLTTDDNKEEYYDKNGTKTTKNEYLKQCQINICTIIDGTYFDLSGKQVSETEYKKSCYSCAKENNKYYDKDGKEITESEWKATCEKPKCVEKDGKYYDNNGNEVSEKEFENKCPKNVQTGDNITLKMYLYIGLGLAITIGIMYFSKKHTKISKI